MKGVMENHPLFLSLFLCVAGVAACAWAISPEVNKMVHLYPFPDDSFRWHVMFLVGASLFGTFVWDRLVTAIFSPDIFGAIIDQGRQTSFADVQPILATLFKVVAGFFVFGSGNPLVWFGSWWLYKKYQNGLAQQEEQVKLAQLAQRKKQKQQQKG